jgi:hypothetical protein
MERILNTAHRDISHLMIALGVSMQLADQGTLSGFN